MMYIYRKKRLSFLSFVIMYGVHDTQESNEKRPDSFTFRYPIKDFCKVSLES